MGLVPYHLNPVRHLKYFLGMLAPSFSFPLLLQIYEGRISGCCFQYCTALGMGSCPLLGGIKPPVSHMRLVISIASIPEETGMTRNSVLTASRSSNFMRSLTTQKAFKACIRDRFNSFLFLRCIHWL
jgi:hypothetical protein